MKSLSNAAKRCGAVFGVLILSELLIVLFGSVATYGRVVHDDGFTTVEGAFVSFAPDFPHPALSILDLLGYRLGLGISGFLLLACGSFGLSFIAGVLLVSSSGIPRSFSSPLRWLVLAAYCATPILAATVILMLLYAIVIRSPTFA